MRKLSKDEYYAIMQKNKQSNQIKEFAELMEKWDDVRTDINPNARWYGDEPEEGSEKGWQRTEMKGYYICAYCGEMYKIPTVLCYPKWRFCPNCGQKNMEV